MKVVVDRRRGAMTERLNARQRKFAQELAEGKSQIEAYANAGYEPDDAHASRLAENGDKPPHRIALVGRR
jgi:hypothetical protein